MYREGDSATPTAKHTLMSVVKFTSDNERGLTALFGDMDGMGVQVVTVGAGQHAHIIERTIRTFKEVIRTSYYSVPYKMPEFMLAHLIINACKKLLLFPTASTQWKAETST
jgi:hypothetical protein